jgi:hypothetical protein
MALTTLIKDALNAGLRVANLKLDTLTAEIIPTAIRLDPHGPNRACRLI